MTHLRHRLPPGRGNRAAGGRVRAGKRPRRGAMSGRNRWVVPAAAGAAALAVVAGVVGVAAARGSAGARSAAGVRSAAASRPLPSGTAGALAPPEAVVHDGDRVRGQGLVVALPGRPVRLCSGVAPQVAPPTRTPAYCAIGLTLVGADLD